MARIQPHYPCRNREKRGNEAKNRKIEKSRRKVEPVVEDVQRKEQTNRSNNAHPNHMLKQQSGQLFEAFSALLQQTSVQVLCDPTSGVDAVSRRINDDQCVATSRNGEVAVRDKSIFVRSPVVNRASGENMDGGVSEGNGQKSEARPCPPKSQTSKAARSSEKNNCDRISHRRRLGGAEAERQKDGRSWLPSFLNGEQTGEGALLSASVVCVVGATLPIGAKDVYAASGMQGGKATIS